MFEHNDIYFPFLERASSCSRTKHQITAPSPIPKLLQAQHQTDSNINSLTWWSASGQLAVQPCCSWSSSMMTTSFPVHWRSWYLGKRQFPEKPELVSIRASGVECPTRWGTGSTLVSYRLFLNLQTQIQALPHFHEPL